MYLKKSKATDYSIKANDSNIKSIVKKTIMEEGVDADLNNIIVSEVTDMSDLFYGSDFNGDLHYWDVSNVKNMNRMFYGSKFNGNISHWDVNNVKYHVECFDGSPLENQKDKQPKFK